MHRSSASAHLTQALYRAKATGDLNQIRAGYLAMLQQPTCEQEFHGTRGGHIEREVAQVEEALGLLDSAAQRYRTASARSSCGHSNNYETQLQGLIRVAERQHHQCGTIVIGRMILADADESNAYGLQRLRDAGYDVERLFRGALLTAYRQLPQSELKALLTNADFDRYNRALIDIGSRGAADWAEKTDAFLGYALTAGRRALPLFMRTALQGPIDYRQEALWNLRAMLRIPGKDPCSTTEKLNSCLPGMGEYRNCHLPAFNFRCETKLTLLERTQIARALLPLLQYGLDRSDLHFANNVVEVLGEIASPDVKQPLQQLQVQLNRWPCSVGDYSCDALKDLKESVIRALKKITAHAN